MLATPLSKITPSLAHSSRSLDAYQAMWNSMVIRPEMVKKIASEAGLILKYQKQFELAVLGTKIPWQFAGIIYYRECSCSFKGHPHNGDSLRKRTVNVPAGRPLKNPVDPPGYHFIESWNDLAQLKGWGNVATWDIPTLLYYFESNNGVGYRRLHIPINSPYLWAGTNHYDIGKFDRDGHYNPKLIDDQIGAAPLLQYLTT